MEICFFADGTIDAFIDLRGKLRTTDIAAAVLIIQEAGATITTPQNTNLSIPLDPKETAAFITAANPKLHKTILQTIEKA